MAKMKAKAKPMIPPPEPGMYPAVCIYSIDVGEQAQDWKGTTKYAQKFVLGFELCGETVLIDGEQKPRVLSRWFTYSASEKSGIRKLVNAWTGKQMTDEEAMELDSNDLVGKAGLVNVVLNEDGTRANIESVMPLMRGMAAPVPVSELIRYDMEPWDQTAFDSLPEWAQEIIKKSTQYQKDHPSTDEIQVKQEGTPTGKQEGKVPF